MNAIRTFLYYLVFLPACVVLAGMALTSYGLFRIRPYWVLRLYGKITRILLKTIGNVSIQINGNQNLKFDEPILIISNHVSALDTIALSPILKQNNFTYVVKNSLMQWKSFPFNIGCRTTWCIPVSREANAGDLTLMLDECKKRFEKNISVLIFPKGTRESDLTLSADIPPTGILIAKKLKCSVLPVFFDTINWQNGKIIKDAGPIKPGTVQIHIGQLITQDQIKSIKETNANIIGFFHECIKLSKNIHLSNSENSTKV